MAESFESFNPVPPDAMVACQINFLELNSVPFLEVVAKISDSTILNDQENTLRLLWERSSFTILGICKIGSIMAIRPLNKGMDTIRPN